MSDEKRLNKDLRYWLDVYAEKFGDSVNLLGLTREQAINDIEEAIKTNTPIPEPPNDNDL